MRIETFVTDALGDASHLLIAAAAAAVIDPQRDVRPFVEEAKRSGVIIEYVVETHVHNDYVSGGRELAERGAKLVAPKDSGIQFPHIALAEGEDILVGGARLSALAAPGHTYEHTAYLVTAPGESRPTAAFTGGSLLMGSAGRSDLLGPDHTEKLTRAQWESIQRMASLLPSSSMVYPTHGAGSFCSSSSGTTDRFGALRDEQGRNPALSLASYELFREVQLQPAPTPQYYRYIAPINRQGPEVYGTPPSASRLDATQARKCMEAGSTVVDIRPAAEYAAGHLPGSLNIEHGSLFLAYVGWFVPFNGPIVLVAPSVEQANIATLDLFRIGYERVEGVLLASDIPAAERETFVPLSVNDAEAALATGERPVVDVRFSHEQAEAPLAGAIAAPIEQLGNHLDHVDRLPADAIVICEAGYRASIAASVMRSRGLRAVPVLGAGVTELQQRMSVRA